MTAMVLVLVAALLVGLLTGGLVAYRVTLVTGRGISGRAVRELEEIYEGLRTAHAIQLAMLDAQASLGQRRHQAVENRSRGSVQL